MNYKKEIEKIKRKYKLLQKDIHGLLGVPETVVYKIFKVNGLHIKTMAKREEGRHNIDILDKRIPELLGGKK